MNNTLDPETASTLDLNIFRAAFMPSSPSAQEGDALLLPFARKRVFRNGEWGPPEFDYERLHKLGFCP